MRFSELSPDTAELPLSQLSVSEALRASAPVALCFMVGLLTHNRKLGIVTASGAFTVGFAPFNAVSGSPSFTMTITTVSHMTHCPMTSFDLKSISPPADPQFQAKQPQGGAQVIFTEQPAGWKGAWHENQKVQWIIPLKGTWFVQAMDGKRVNLGPGDVSLGEDQNTKLDANGHKGHLSGNVSNGPVSLMVIQLAETPTVNQPCRFK